MRRGARPLLCELHAHTTWSDGDLSPGALVDLYGTASFDVLCVTDHVLRRDDRWPLRHGRPCVDTSNVGAYLAEIERQRARALSAHGLLLVPGLELTYNDPNPDRACHAVAVGLHSLVAMDDGPAAAMEQARAAGAAILAAHPHDSGPTPAVPSPTRYFTRVGFVNLARGGFPGKSWALGLPAFRPHVACRRTKERDSSGCVSVAECVLGVWGADCA
jgi:hypothetical protein